MLCLLPIVVEEAVACTEQLPECIVLLEELKLITSNRLASEEELRSNAARLLWGDSVLVVVFNRV